MNCYIGIDLGGTNLRAAVADTDTGQVFHQRKCPTLAAEGQEAVIQRIVQLIRDLTQVDGIPPGSIKGVGIGVPGTPDIEAGIIQILPNLPGKWLNVPLQAIIEAQVGLPVALINDVRAITLGEWTFGAGRGAETLVCLAIGTGIGGGYLINGKPLIGLLNLEMGHLRIPHSRELDPFDGNCPFHGDCFEGLASGPAIEKRLGVTGATVPESETFWDIEAGYIASALMNYILTLSPKKIIVGGGVMQREFLFPKVRNRVSELLNGYVSSKVLLEQIDQYIVPPGLGNQSGSMGAIALAMQLEETMNDPRF